MGRLIDADRLKDTLEYGILCNVPADAANTEEEKWNDWVQEVVDKAPTVEAIPKVDYEARLKADMVAMLEELRLEFEEYEPKWAENDDHKIASCRTWEDFDDIIQQKIDALRKETNNVDTDAEQTEDR